jgi:hypothetical protein
VLTAVLKHAVNSKECQPCTVSFFGQQDWRLHIQRD